MRKNAPEILALLKSETLHIYRCGLKGLETGVEAALTEIAAANDLDWPAIRETLRGSGRFHVETY
jgi:sulfite reductase alpha subunit-like flavoprotein